MNKAEITKKTRSAAAYLLEKRGYIAPVELLLHMNVISDQVYENWRMGRIPYLEKATNCGLGKLNTIMKALRAYSTELNLKPSLIEYKKWGKGKKVRLRFSKTGSHHVEKLYSTHYIKP